MTYTINKKNTLFYYIAIALIAMLLAVFYNNSVKVKSTEILVEHSQEVIDKNNEILLDIINIESGARGFILTNKEAFLVHYNDSQGKINQNIESLLFLTKDNPNQQIRVKQLKKIISERIEISKSLIDNNNNNKEVELATILKGKVLMDSIRENIKSINVEELSLLKNRKSNYVLTEELSEYLLYALFILLLVLIFFIYFLFKNHKKQSLELESFNIYQKEASQYSLSLIEASLDPLVTINNEGKITDLNQATVRVTGIDKEHLIGSDFFGYFTDHQKAREVYQKVFTNGSVTDAPLTIRHKEGKLTDVLFNGSVYKDELGTIKGVVIVARDIAEQKWALDLRKAYKELELQNEEKEYRANELLIANEELAFQNQEKENRANELLIANQELEYQSKLKEKKAKELIIADIELDFQNEEKEKRVIENKELEAYNYSLKLASQYSRSLIEASLDPLVTINAEGKITDVNNASIKVTGVEREKLVGTNFSNYFTEPKKAQDGYRQVFENGYVEDYPLTIKHINGKLTDVLYNASVYKDDNDKVLGVFAAARDITEQNKQKLKSDSATKNLEDSINSLQLASQYSRSLIEASLDPLVTISAEGMITDVNNASIKVTGVEREKLIGTDFSNYFTEPENAQKGYRQVFENGYVEGYPLTIKHIDGKLVDVLYNASVYKDDNGNVLGVFAAARDITEQNKEKLKSEIANKNLEASNDSLKLASQYSLGLIESSRDPMFVISVSGKITDTNQATVNATDILKNNLIGSDFITYFTEPEKAKNGYQEVFSKGFVIDYPLTIKDGHLTPVLFNGSVYKDTNNNVIGAVVVARDISAQKKAEKELLESLNEVTDYKLALDASTIVDITDKDGNIKFVNKNYTKISKYAFDELVGGSHSMVNSKFHPTAFMENLWERISKGKIWKGEIRNKAKDGSFYWLNMTIVPFRDDMGLPFQYVAISIDITKQKELEQELMEAKVFAELATTIAEESRNSAEDAVKSKQQFLSNMSHEIRTPMNAIIGFTKVVLKTELTAKQKEYLMAIKMSGDSLIVLINDILDLAKVDSGKMTFEKTPFKLALSITAMLHLFETKIQEKNLELITNYDATIPEVLLGDPIRLNQIILNLVSNAVKFTNKGTIAVNIKMLSQDDEKVQIEFSVIDTGIGIKPTKIGKIFENFQQATNTTSRLYGGTGLGLAIVKQLVEAQGGSIKIDSTFGKGSTFSIVLDFKKTNIDAVLEPEILELNTDVKNIKILVVEDMELNQLLMKTLLDDFGFECDITANGQLAIEKLETKTYDIILMDLQMPVMNGFEATEYIRKKMKLKMPIIALTADVTTVDVEKCKAVGMNDYISKPVDERLLYSKLIAYSKKPIAIIEHIKGEVHSKDTIKYVDMSYLTKLTKSDPNLMSQMINAYLQQTPPLILSMKKSLVDKDWKMLQSAVHKMIPSFSIIGLSSNIHDIAKRIQEYAFTIEITGEIQNMVLELEKVCTQSCIELEIELEKLKIENLEKRK